MPRGSSEQPHSIVTQINRQNGLSVQPKRWFALSVRARHEKMVARALRQRDLEAFLPLYQVKRRWSDRYRLVDLPLFPTYLFCRLSHGEHSAALQVPGVRSVVGRMEGPEPIDEREIEAVRTIVGSGVTSSPCSALREGQWVRVRNGPLFGCEGVLERTKGSCRLVITVSLLHRAIAVEVDQSWVMPIMPPPHHETGRRRPARRFGLASRGRVAAAR